MFLAAHGLIALPTKASIAIVPLYAMCCPQQPSGQSPKGQHLVTNCNVLCLPSVGSRYPRHTTSNDQGPSDHAACYGRDLLPSPSSTVSTLDDPYSTRLQTTANGWVSSVPSRAGWQGLLCTATLPWWMHNVPPVCPYLRIPGGSPLMIPSNDALNFVPTSWRRVQKA